MSLLSENFTTCTPLTMVTAADGYGGHDTEWKDGEPIQAAIVRNSDTQTKIAEAQGTKAIYTITTRKSTNLHFHDVIRREEDKKIFRITSDGDDNKTPKGAALNMRQVTAEEWELTDGQSTSD